MDYPVTIKVKTKGNILERRFSYSLPPLLFIFRLISHCKQIPLRFEEYTSSFEDLYYGFTGYDYCWLVKSQFIHWMMRCRRFGEHSGCSVIIRCLPISWFVYQFHHLMYQYANTKHCEVIFEWGVQRIWGKILAVLWLIAGQPANLFISDGILPMVAIWQGNFNV